MIVAVFGSREGISKETVESYLEPRYNYETVLVSGGAKGVDNYAEAYWINRGGRVLSYRPCKITPEEFGVELWWLGSWSDGQRIVRLEHPHPTWRRYDGALTYRSMLVAACADRGVAFLANGSYGTGRTVWFLEQEGKPCVIKEEEHESVTE